MYNTVNTILWIYYCILGVLVYCLCTIGHEKLGDEINIPVSRTTHTLRSLLSLPKVLV